MIAFLMGVPGKLTTLTNRLTSTWAAKLDTLATDYTTARAAKIDKLDAAITSRTSASVWTNALATQLAAAPSLRIPAASGLAASVQNCYGGTGIKPVGCNIYYECESTSFVTAYSYTGSGILHFAAAGLPESSTFTTITLKITIDGVVVGELTSASDLNGAYVVLVGIFFMLKVLMVSLIRHQEKLPQTK